MNTTDYFTYVNAMFLFCIFTCGLLVWAVIRGYILKGKLLKEQDSHLKSTNTNTLLNKALSAKNAALQANEHKLRDAEKEIRELQSKLDHADADRIELRAERATLENKLTDALAKVRKRDKDGKFLPSGNGRVKKDEKKPNSNGLLLSHAFNELSDHAKEASAALDNFSELVSTTTSPKLVHGLTVKNPTKAEAKMIFDEAKRLGIKVSKNDLGVPCPNIWVYHKKICVCIEGVEDYEWVTFVTAKEFFQRMKNGRG